MPLFPPQAGFVWSGTIFVAAGSLGPGLAKGRQRSATTMDLNLMTNTVYD